MKGRILWLILGILTAATAVSAQGLPRLRIVTSGFFHPMSAICAQILPEAYGSLGYQLDFVDVPPNRAVLEINSGLSDAYVFSDDLFLDAHPGAIKVDYPIGYDDMVVFTKDADFAVTGWASLKPYSVGFLQGMWIVEHHLEGLASDPADTPPQVLLKLAAGRTDIAVLPYGLGLMMLKETGIRNLRILRPALVRVPLYHFLAAKNAALAPKLAQAFEALARSGRLKEVTDQVYDELAKATGIVSSGPRLPP